jgi:uncharacterized protein with NRDE domain
MEHGGTWLGVTRGGRLAALTNFRDRATQKGNAPSRGLLVSGFLRGQDTPREYLQRVSESSSAYNDFNLFVADRDSFWYFSSRTKEIRAVAAGIHGVSNHLTDSPWPKVDRGKAALARVLAGPDGPSAGGLLAVLNDRFRPPDSDLPDTGVGIELERALAPAFVVTPSYGTRCSTVLLIERSDRIHFTERSFEPGGAPVADVEFTLDGDAAG